MAKEYSALVTVEFIVTTQAAHRREAQRKISRVVLGTVKGGVHNRDDMLRTIKSEINSVRIVHHSTTMDRIVAKSTGDLARDLSPWVRRGP